MKMWILACVPGVGNLMDAPYDIFRAIKFKLGTCILAHHGLSYLSLNQTQTVLPLLFLFY